MNALREIRKAKGMTQQELADIVGVDFSAVSHWEKGDAIPRGELMPTIADALGCTIDELFGRGERHGAVSEDSADT